VATILVVDDEPMMLRLCKEILRRGQHEVFEAEEGQEALQFLQQRPVELAVLDVMMPQMNGIVLAGRIQRMHPNTKVLLMTGYAKAEVAQVAGKENPYRIIWKPFKAESLLRMVENVLGEN
jgi:DNA-binding NtrC family response regulator